MTITPLPLIPVAISRTGIYWQNVRDACCCRYERNKNKADNHHMLTPSFDGESLPRT